MVENCRWQHCTLFFQEIGTFFLLFIVIRFLPHKNTQLTRVFVLNPLNNDWYFLVFQSYISVFISIYNSTSRYLDFINIFRFLIWIGGYIGILFCKPIASQIQAES